MKSTGIIKAIMAIMLVFQAAAMDLSRTSDPIYEDLQVWATRGLIRQLPNFRPYPLVLVKKFLEEVVTNGSALDAARAQTYLDQISPNPRVGARALHSSLFAVGFPNHDYNGTTGGKLTHNGFLHPGVGFSGFAGALVVDWAALTAFPLGRRTAYDFLKDDSAIEVLDRSFLVTLTMGGTLSLGTPELYAQLGLNRHGFGPFMESVVFSPSAKEAASIGFTWRPEGFTYSKYLLALNATKDTDSRPITTGMAFHPNKYLTGHSFQFFLWDFLEIGLYETVVFGQRFEPHYLIPGMSLLYSSIYTGMWDNILVGANLVVRLPFNIRIAGEFHADDLHFLRLFALRFDGKTKIAAQAGIDWFPGLGIFEGVQLRYALVTPYTFTHVREFITGGASDQSHINYVNYTHSGEGLINLEPNSDRIEGVFRLRPNAQLSANFTFRRLRHGNASDDGYSAMSEEFIGTTDGGFFDSGYVSPGGPHKYDTNRFLNQPVIESLFQFGVDYSLTLFTGLGDATITGGYMFEYGVNRRGSPTPGNLGAAAFHNRGVPVLGNNGVRHYVFISVAFQL